MLDTKLKCVACGYVGNFWKDFFHDEYYDEDTDDYYCASKCPKCGIEEEEYDDDKFIEVD